MIRAEILLQGGHTVTIETQHPDIGVALGKLKSDLTGGWLTVGDRYLIHPGSVAGVRFFDTAHEGGVDNDPRDQPVSQASIA